LAVTKAELKSTKDNLADMEERYAATRESLILTSKDLEELRIKSELKEKTAHADYSDLNDSMTTLVEEANKKVKEAEMNVEQLMKKLGEADLQNDQLQGQLQIKDAELAEAEVSSHIFFIPEDVPWLTTHQAQAALFKSTSGGTGSLGAAGNAADGEEIDHSSTALALVREPLSTVTNPATIVRAQADISI
jgi:hypothetical protein